ncbi:MAG: diaminopimelate epimerase [Lachnospiraceae bacterium]|nr:diaminopimelate epimerase [Lachnospiraceae bacterium]
MKFTKMHGIGNDYIYFNCFETEVLNPESLSIKLSDRHFGVGGDGIVLIMPSDKADFRMRMFNADGSEGAMCGNATRCIGKYVYEKGLTDKTEITLETKSGIKYLTLNVTDGKVETVAVDMGAPKIGAVGGTLTANNTEYTYTFVDVGNPHCVIFTDDDVEKLELEKIGPAIENHKLFPDRANVEFVNVIDESNLRMRVWERGSGETWACGTGACATTVAAVANNISQKNTDVKVKLNGGTLSIKYTDDTVLMTGPAAFVFEGELAE